MNCTNCGEVVSFRMKKAIERNECVYCGSSLNIDTNTYKSLSNCLLGIKYSESTKIDSFVRTNILPVIIEALLSNFVFKEMVEVEQKEPESEVDQLLSKAVEKNVLHPEALDKVRASFENLSEKEREDILLSIKRKIVLREQKEND